MLTLLFSCFSFTEVLTKDSAKIKANIRMVLQVRVDPVIFFFLHFYVVVNEFTATEEVLFYYFSRWTQQLCWSVLKSKSFLCGNYYAGVKVFPKIYQLNKCLNTYYQESGSSAWLSSHFVFSFPQGLRELQGMRDLPETHRRDVF